MTERVWRMPEPHTAEDREAGVGYLIWGSELEREVRDRIASAFLHDVIGRMGRPSASLPRTRGGGLHAVAARAPAVPHALELAQSHPDVEKYAIPEEDVPAWQTAIEVGSASSRSSGRVSPQLRPPRDTTCSATG